MWVGCVGVDAGKEMERKEWRPTGISAVSTQLTKCCGIGELPNLLTLLDFLIHIALVIFAVLTLADAYAG